MLIKMKNIGTCVAFYYNIHSGWPAFVESLSAHIDYKQFKSTIDNPVFVDRPLVGTWSDPTRGTHLGSDLRQATPQNIEKSGRITHKIKKKSKNLGPCYVIFLHLCLTVTIFATMTGSFCFE